MNWRVPYYPHHHEHVALKNRIQDKLICTLVSYTETYSSETYSSETPRPVIIKMVLLEKLWDDVVAGPQPERGLGKLRKITTSLKDEGEGSSRFKRSTSMPMTPTTPGTPPTPGSGRKVDNVWRSVFHPGSNSATKTMGAQMFDKPLPNSPTVYDWLYSGDSRSNHR